MATFIALLRAVNVGGTGKLPMKEQSALCMGLDFKKVCTYIQSGNVVLESALSPEKIQTRLEQALTKRMGKPVEVLVRSASNGMGQSKLKLPPVVSATTARNINTIAKLVATTAS